MNISQMTILSDKVAYCLKTYLDKVATYKGFRDDMPVRVYVAPDGDFLAFEAVDYNLSFTSNSHKLYELKSSVQLDHISIKALKDRVSAL